MRPWAPSPWCEARPRAPRGGPWWWQWRLPRTPPRATPGLPVRAVLGRDHQSARGLGLDLDFPELVPSPGLRSSITIGYNSNSELELAEVGADLELGER